MGISKSIKVDVVGLTDTGLVREHNEDDFLIVPAIGKQEEREVPLSEMSYDVPDKGSLFVVVDGMGGANAGEVAVELVMQSLQGYFHNYSKKLLACETDADIERFFTDATQYCNDKLSVLSQKNKEMMGIGATLVFAWVRQSKAYIGWVGDCRAYCYRPNSLELLTEDHSLENEMIKNGQLSGKGEIDNQYHIITQKLGSHKKTIQPGFLVRELEKHDKLLLLTDGIHGLVPDSKIQKCFEREINGNAVIREVIRAANQAGGYDNIAVLLSEVLEVGVAVEKEGEVLLQSQTVKKVLVFTAIVASVAALLFYMLVS